jgi:hypothetical protein
VLLQMYRIRFHLWSLGELAEEGWLWRLAELLPFGWEWKPL